MNWALIFDAVTGAGAFSVLALATGRFTTPSLLRGDFPTFWSAVYRYRMDVFMWLIALSRLFTMPSTGPDTGAAWTGAALGGLAWTAVFAMSSVTPGRERTDRHYWRRVGALQGAAVIIATLAEFGQAKSLIPSPAGNLMVIATYLALGWCLYVVSRTRLQTPAPARSGSASTGA